jgi:cysteinyl-tRNA synthetase
MRSVLLACDSLRDDTLPNAGVRLEDSTTGGAGVWKLLSPEDALELKAQQAKARALKESKAAEKAARQEEARKKEEALVGAAAAFVCLSVCSGGDAASSVLLWRERENRLRR